MAFALSDGILFPPTCTPEQQRINIQNFEFPNGVPSRQRAQCSSPFASVAASHPVSPTTTAAPKISERREPATGAAFPGLYCPDRAASAPCPVLLGLGQRQKRLLGLKNISAYAVGLYLDPAVAKKLVQKQPGLSPAALQQVYDELIQETKAYKSLRMVITFGKVNSGNFYSALSERLKPQMQTPEEHAALEEFGARFQGVKFYKGMPLAFITSGNGKLVTRIDEQEIGTTTSLGLTRALFNTYLGDDPVSPSAKESIGQGLLQIATQPPTSS